MASPWRVVCWRFILSGVIDVPGQGNRLRNRLLLLSLLFFILFVSLNGAIVLINSSMLSRFMTRHLGEHLTEKAMAVNLQIQALIAANHDLLDLHAADLNLVIAIKRHRLDILDELFADWRDGSVFRSFVLTDAGGTVQPSPSRGASHSLAGRRWFREAGKRGVSAICPGVGPHPTAVIWLNSPVHVRGKTYFLLASIDWNSLTSFLATSPLLSRQDRNFHPLILGPDYRLLYLPSFLQNRKQRLQQALRASVATALENVPLAEEQGCFHDLSLLGRVYRVAYARSPQYGWTVLYLQDREVDRALTARVSRRNLLVSSLLLFLGMGILLFFLWKVSTPLHQLLNVTGQILQGRYPDQIDIEADEEIRQVIRAMNRMIEDVRMREEEVHRLYEQEKEAARKLARANVLLAEQSSELQYKNDELKHAFEELQTVHEELLEAERLAVVGETSGRVAHEVLNPVTAIMFRVEKDLAAWSETEDVIRGMEEILADWWQEFGRGTLAEYFLSPGESGTTYGEEDISLLRAMAAGLRDGAGQRRKNLQFIFIQIQRVIKIINALRESAVATRSITRFPIARPVEEALELLYDALQKRAITTRVTMPRPVPFVDGELTELTQVITNLLRNAMQSIDQKRSTDGRISIAGTLNRDRVEIRISDNGVGIPPEISGSVFDPHFTTKDKKRGTGLGLGISRRFIREHGGELRLETSRMGEGSTFLIVLPIVANCCANGVGS